MDLIEFGRDQLFLGMSVRYTLRDAEGRLLLAQGQRIETRQQLDGLKSRGQIFVEIDQTEAGVRAMMSGISALNRADAPIKDFSKYLNLKQGASDEEKLTGTLAERWGDVESKLGGLLASLETTSGFEARLRTLERFVSQLVQEDSNASQFLLFNRAVTHFGGYSLSHALLCAALVGVLAESFALNDVQKASLVCAALTMNLAMTQAQDQLAIQKHPPSPHQRAVIDGHASAGRQLLSAAGVTDSDWLTVVALHHTAFTLPGDLLVCPPGQRMVKILQVVDRYTAAMSPRKSRAGRNARDSARSVLVSAATAKHDEVGTALVRMLGLCPPGTFVKLANGETAVVLRRGSKPAEPWVAAVLNRLDEPIAEPRLRDSSREGFKVQSAMVATDVRVTLNSDQMLRLIPRGEAAG